MLTKTHFVLEQRCQKALYFNIFSPKLANQSSNLELKLRQEGIEVGKYAIQKVFRARNTHLAPDFLPEPPIKLAKAFCCHGS